MFRYQFKVLEVIMSLFLSILLVNALPDFTALSPVQFTFPDSPVGGWSLDCTGIDYLGRIIVGCSRDRERGMHEVNLFLVGESTDTVIVADNGISSLISILPDSMGGFFITFPSEFHSDEVSAARLNADGSLDWREDVEQGLKGSVAYAETPGGGLVVGGDPNNSNGNITVLGEDGVFCWEVEGEPYTEVNAVIAHQSGLIVAGQKEGSVETQPFVWCYDYSGDLLWEHGYDIGGFSGFDCAASLPDGFIFGGTHSSQEGPQYGLLIRTDQSGNEMWTKLIPAEEGYQQVHFLAVSGTDNDSIIAAGFSGRNNAPRNTVDAIVVLLNAAGDVCDHAFYGKPEQNFEEFRWIFREQNGGLRFYGLGFGNDYDGTCPFGFPPINLDE